MQVSAVLPGRLKQVFGAILLSILVVMLARPVQAADAEFVGIEEVWQGNASAAGDLKPFALSLMSSASVPKRKQLRFLDRLDGILYIVRIRIDNKLFYRLLFGNFASRDEAIKALKGIREWFPGGWVVKRSAKERQQLQKMLVTGKKKGIPLHKKASAKRDQMPEEGKDPALAEKLLEQARQKLLDADYGQTLRFTDKILEVGSRPQREKALELSGIARERQKRFAQAIKIYREFLSLYPDSKRVPIVRSRLQGLLTMREEPRKKLAKDAPKEQVPWTYYGTFSQYYRHDTLAQQNQGTQNTGKLLSSDLDVTARRKGDDDFWQLRFNGGVINDFNANSSEGRVSRAEVRYQNDVAEYELIGGRQSRTISGLSGRFDGLVFTKFDPQTIDYSLFLGSPVQSVAQGLDSSHWFVGGGIKYRPLDHLTLDGYLYTEQASGLTDRQTIGVEWQYRNRLGFLFGTAEYDFNFGEIDHISLVGNYQTPGKWVLNLNWDYRFSPPLSILNALQGQTATTLDELKLQFTDSEIQQLARDRTARNQTLFVGATYSIDINRLISLNASWSSTEATVASGGVEANPKSSELQLSADYSFKGWLIPDDFATWGVRLSDSDTSSVLSLQARSRMATEKRIFYTPRVRLDYRDNKNDDVTQWILAPEIKASYKPSKDLSLEASFGIEYSNFNLPDLNDQTAYSLYLSYFYQF